MGMGHVYILDIRQHTPAFGNGADLGKLAEQTVGRVDEVGVGVALKVLRHRCGELAAGLAQRAVHLDKERA